LQLSAVHAFPSLQLSTVPAVQVPVWQLSAPLQTFPSRHAVPLAALVFWHAPELQASMVQAFPSLQSAATEQVWHPLIGVCTQPVTGLHESVVQAFESLQLSAVPAEQVPDWQVSGPLHALPSAHDVPFASGVFAQPVAGTQESVVQTLLSLQLGGVPAVQVPD
jgi:hypothetical protein